MCNPGELCTSTGMSEAEMMKLVEQKMRAGVPPPWEWAVVSRCVGAAGVAGRAGQRGGGASWADGPEVGGVVAGSPLAAPPPAQEAAIRLAHMFAVPSHCCRPAPGGGSELKRLPMGALRASCGHMSRCAALYGVCQGWSPMARVSVLCTRPCSSPVPNWTCATYCNVSSVPRAPLQV